MNMNQQNEISLIMKEAAGMKTWMREKLLPSGWTRGIGEGLIGDYKEKMEVLRYVDDQIYELTKDLSNTFSEDHFDAIKDALKGNRLVDFALLLADLNNKLKKITELGKEVEQLSENSLTEFDTENEYAGQFTPEEIEEAFKADDGIVSEAGYISDLKRKWVDSKMENDLRKKRKFALEQLLSRTKVLIGRVMQNIDLLSQARASGEIGQYINQLKKIEKEQKNFENQFFPIYRTYLKPLVDRVIAQEKERNKENDKPVQEQEVVNEEPEEWKRETLTDINEPTNRIQPPPLPPEIPNLEQKDIDQSIIENEAKSDFEEKPKKTPKEKAPKSIPPLAVSEEAPKLDRRVIRSPADLKVEPEETPKPAKPSKKKKPQPIPEAQEQKPAETKPEEPKKESSSVEIAIQKRANANFIHELAKASSTDNPMLIVRMILKYAEDIEDSQPENSIALTELAEQILQ